MPDSEKMVVSAYVEREVVERLDELLVPGEKRSNAIAAAIHTEVKLRERAMETLEAEEGVSRET